MSADHAVGVSLIAEPQRYLARLSLARATRRWQQGDHNLFTCCVVAGHRPSFSCKCHPIAVGGRSEYHVDDRER